MWVMYDEGDVWWGSCMMGNMYGGSMYMYDGDDVWWGDVWWG